MSEAINAVSNDNESSQSTTPSTTSITSNPTSQAGAVQANTAKNNSADGGGGSGGFNSMEDLKNSEPELYQKMMESIGMKICNQMRQHQAHLKEMMREARRNA